MVVFSVPEDASFNGRVIYKFTSPEDKGYVGKSVTFKSRMSKHRSEAYAKKDGDWVKKTKWKEAIRQFGWENLRVEILERVPKEVSLEERECYWIARLNTVFPNGYNMNEGGGGVIKHTEEAKAKMSAAHKGKTLTEETKAKMSAAHIGKTRTDKHQAKLIAAISKPVTSRLILESYTNGTQLVKFDSYTSATEAERKTKINQSAISACCKKNRKSAGGRYWHFTKEGDLDGEHCVERFADIPMPGSKHRQRALFSEYPDGRKQLHEGTTAAGHNLFKLTGKKFHNEYISECCNPKHKKTHYKGLKFYYATPELIAQFKKQASKKRKRE